MEKYYVSNTSRQLVLEDQPVVPSSVIATNTADARFGIVEWHSAKMSNGADVRQHRCLQGTELQIYHTRSRNHSQVPVTGRLKLGGYCNSSSSNSNGSGSNTANHDGEMMTYLTNFSIDHDQQSDGLCRDVMFDECVPCFDGTERRKHCRSWKIVSWFLWAIISSELFLYSLHVTSIIIGALKEVLDLRETLPRLSLLNSGVETSATLLLILIRMANAYTGYREIRKTVRHEENFDPDKDIHVRLLKKWMIVFELVGLILFGFSIACFIVFFYHVHLGWTILSNNLCMITILVMATLYRARVVIAITRVREDQHKVAIYEAVLIIEQAEKIPRDDATDQTTEAHNNVQRMLFTRAVRLTKLFDKPGYIGLLSENGVGGD